MRLSLVGALVACFAACGSDDKPTGTVSVKVGKAGGTVQTPDGTVKLEITSGALAADVLITVDPTDHYPKDSGTVAGTFFEFGPAGTTFSVPVKLAIAYAPKNIPADVDEASLRLFKVKSDGWLEMPESTVDVDRQVVTAKIDSFSIMGLGAGLSGDLDLGVDTTADAGLADSGSDASSDVEADAALTDLAPDGIADATSEAAPDATPDAAVDAAADVVTDAAPDAMADAAPDTMADAAPDAVPDAAPDAVPDTVVDAIPDVPADIPVSTVACRDGIDNDSDGLIDALDPDCTGPNDNDESSLATGIPGDNIDPCSSDCHFDGNSASGDDQCEWDLRCDPADPGSTISGSCTYDAAYPHCPTAQSTTCKQTCLPIVPNGCDCFGCCAVYKEGIAYTVLIWEGCQAADPTSCPSCTPVADCTNPCETCELCIGKTIEDLPTSCFSTDAGPQLPSCDAGLTPCLTHGDCAAAEYCLTGCCIPAS